MIAILDALQRAVETCEIMTCLIRIEKQLKEILPNHKVYYPMENITKEIDMELVIERPDQSILYRGKPEQVEEALLYFPPSPIPYHFQIPEKDKNRLLVWRVMRM